MILDPAKACITPNWCIHRLSTLLTLSYHGHVAVLAHHLSRTKSSSGFCGLEPAGQGDMLVNRYKLLVTEGAQFMKLTNRPFAHPAVHLHPMLIYKTWRRDTSCPRLRGVEHEAAR